MRTVKLLFVMVGLWIWWQGCQIVYNPIVHAVYIEKDSIFAFENYRAFQILIDPDDILNTYTDRFKSIDNIGFQIWAHNAGETDANFSIRADDGVDTLYVTRDDVIKHTLPVFASPKIRAAGDFYVDWGGSFKYIQNREAFNAYPLDFRFSLYFIPESPQDEIVLDSIVVIITAVVE